MIEHDIEIRAAFNAWAEAQNPKIYPAEWQAFQAGWQASLAAQPSIHQHGFAGTNQRLRAVNESLDKQLDEVMTERDEYHDMADRLAQAIADHLLVEIGEHSSANCPWMRALEAIENAPQPSGQAPDYKALWLREQRERIELQACLDLAMDDKLSGQAQQDAHWYAVDRHGAATFCVSEEDACETAAKAAQLYPNKAPYTAVQMVPVGSGSIFGSRS